MKFLKGVLWVLFAAAMVTVAMYLTGNFEVADRLKGFFLALEPWLPSIFSFDAFLVLVAVLGALIALVAIGACLAMAAWVANQVAGVKQQELAQTAAAKREVRVVVDQHRERYEHILTLAQTLTKRLDKRVLVQAIVEAASTATSASQVSSIVSCWLLQFETDTIRFEMGRYCDAAFFIKTDYQPTESPFAQIITTQRVWIPSEEEAARLLIKPEKRPALGAATRLLLVPLVIEGSALGFLVIACHPDVLRAYEENRAFYEAIWGELSLALAIAVQGEVAILDRLTGVHNREYFMKRLVQELERANRFQLPISLLMIDIDNFKAVNDTLGHPQGDAVLKIIAKLIRKEVRAVDLAGRYGGEEFIVMLPETGYGDEAQGSTGALIVAERIRKAVDMEFSGMQKPLNLSISLGVAVRRFPQDRDTDYRDLIRWADEQLYRAKTTGKNKVCVHQPEGTQASSA